METLILCLSGTESGRKEGKIKHVADSGFRQGGRSLDLLSQNIFSANMVLHFVTYIRLSSYIFNLSILHSPVSLALPTFHTLPHSLLPSYIIFPSASLTNPTYLTLFPPFLLHSVFFFRLHSLTPFLYLPSFNIFQHFASLLFLLPPSSTTSSYFTIFLHASLTCFLNSITLAHYNLPPHLSACSALSYPSPFRPRRPTFP